MRPMRFALLALLLAALPARSSAQVVALGQRVRLALTDHVPPRPNAKPGKLHRIEGTLRVVEPDTVRVEITPDSMVAVPRILIYEVERSLGKDFDDVVADAASGGLGIGVLAMLFVTKPMQRVAVVAAGGLGGALFGMVHPYERWEHSWLPE